jgi:hypothetical protein
MKVKIITPSETRSETLPDQVGNEVVRIFKQLRYKGSRATYKALASRFKRPGWVFVDTAVFQFQKERYIESIETVGDETAFVVKEK